MVELNHTIVHAHDREASARFMTEILGLPAPRPFGPFLVVDTANGVSLDFIATDEKLIIEHYAFLVSEAEFDEIFGRIKAARLLFPGPERALSGNYHTALRQRRLARRRNRSGRRD